MTNVSRRTDKSSRIPIKRSSSLRRRPDLLKAGSSVGSGSSAATPTPPAPAPVPKPEVGEDRLVLTDPEEAGPPDVPQTVHSVGGQRPSARTRSPLNR